MYVFVLNNDTSSPPSLLIFYSLTFMHKKIIYFYFLPCLTSQFSCTFTFSPDSFIRLVLWVARYDFGFFSSCAATIFILFGLSKMRFKDSGLCKCSQLVEIMERFWWLSFFFFFVFWMEVGNRLFLVDGKMDGLLA